MVILLWLKLFQLQYWFFVLQLNKAKELAFSGRCWPLHLIMAAVLVTNWDYGLLGVFLLCFGFRLLNLNLLPVSILYMRRNADINFALNHWVLWLLCPNKCCGNPLKVSGAGSGVIPLLSQRAGWSPHTYHPQSLRPEMASGLCPRLAMLSQRAL